MSSRARSGIRAIRDFRACKVGGRCCTAVLVGLLLGVSGCGLKEEAQWVGASGAQEFFANKATQDALQESAVGDLSLGCESLLPAARSVLDEPGSPGLRVLIQACADEGLGFSQDLRCVDGALQVRCL